MKAFLCLASLMATVTLAQAQVLPVPGARNPDWLLDKPATNGRPIRRDTLPSGRDPMPIADPRRQGQGGTDAMPNALSKNIQSIGNHHRYWDAARQLSYDWQSRSGQLGPDSLVTVFQQATGTTFTYRRAPAKSGRVRPQLIPGK
jgi:hypothetical protein